MFHINSQTSRLAILMVQSRLIYSWPAQAHPSEYCMKQREQSHRYPGTCIRYPPAPTHRLDDSAPAQRPINGAQLANHRTNSLPRPAHDLQHGMFESKGRLDWLFGSQRFGTRLRFALSADTLCCVFLRLPHLESATALPCVAHYPCRVTVRCGGMPGECFVS